MLFSCGSHVNQQPPNIVVFLVDDMGWGDLACYGNTLHETPNIDKLSKEGMKFTQGYSACTVCSPSRAALLTGCYPARLHLTDWIPGHDKGEQKLSIPDWQMYIDHERVLLPEALKMAGYNTEFVGKWHLMPDKESEEIKQKHTPLFHGFDINIAGREWGQPKGRGKYFYPFDMPNIEGKEGDYLTDVLTDKAVEFVTSQKKDSPFFLYCSYYTVHWPFMGKDDYANKYKEKMRSGEYKERNNPHFAAMMQSMDESVGRVINALEKKGFGKNTIVVFTSDNGGTSPKSCGGLRGAKGYAYEGGVRVPYIFKYPEVIKPNTECTTPIIGNDLYPTLLELAGLPLQARQHIDGKSLVPLLNREGNIDRDALYWHYPHYHKTAPYGAVRYKDYKLIEYFEDGNLELYNLRNDESESINLVDKQPEMTQKLYSMMLNWRQEVGAQSMPVNPSYKEKE